MHQIMGDPWICQIRPSSPLPGEYLMVDSQFFRPSQGIGEYVVFEDGIGVDCFIPFTKTIILKNDYFCVVKDLRKPDMLYVCLPLNVKGRKVIFRSPNCPDNIGCVVEWLKK